MALTTHTYAEQLGRSLAAHASRECIVEELWVSTRPDGVDLWLVTQPTDMVTAGNLHGLADALYDAFERADFQLFVMNPRHFRGDVHDALPRNAVQIPLRVA